MAPLNSYKLLKEELFLVKNSWGIFTSDAYSKLQKDKNSIAICISLSDINTDSFLVLLSVIILLITKIK